MIKLQFIDMLCRDIARIAIRAFVSIALFSVIGCGPGIGGTGTGDQAALGALHTNNAFLGTWSDGKGNSVCVGRTALSVTTSNGTFSAAQAITVNNLGAAFVVGLWVIGGIAGSTQDAQFIGTLRNVGIQSALRVSILNSANSELSTIDDLTQVPGALPNNCP